MSSVVLILAEVSPSKVKPGWLALIIVLALCIASFLLWRNMNRQLKKIKVPYRDGTKPDGEAGGGADATDDATADPAAAAPPADRDDRPNASG
ncbi:MAG TPA: hypothetical protein VFI30_00225 [Nocardioidaceae bacterium]|nr:hypothetical protein [Nocardioidaceae bacterium]